MTTRSFTTTPTAETDELKGEVLDVLQELLAERRDDEVVSLVRQLVAQNSALRLQLSELVMRRRKGEGVSTAQLKLFLDELEAEENAELNRSNDELANASGLDGKKPPKKKTAQQPRSRQPFPPGLRRIDNPIQVPAAQRPCPICGNERTCIGHDVTEVIELIPAEVVVRLDRREKLACETCEGEPGRARAQGCAPLRSPGRLRRSARAPDRGPVRA